MRIATWNLDRCRAGASDRALKLSAMIADVNADVWVLTETFKDFTPGSDYHLLAHSSDASDREANRGECWVAIWSRCGGQPVNLTADLERVAAAHIAGTMFIGTVLPWLTDDRDPVLRGEAAFRQMLAEQSVDWLRLRDYTSGLCVAGDFNQDLLPTGRYYGSAGGKDALRAALAAARLECLTGGADDPLGGTPALACIDHICIGGLRSMGERRSVCWPAPGTLSRKLTDHYGVWADIEPLTEGATKPRASPRS